MQDRKRAFWSVEAGEQLTYCQPQPFEFFFSGKRSLNDTTNYYLGSSSLWRLTPERARVLPRTSALSLGGADTTTQII